MRGTATAAPRSTLSPLANGIETFPRLLHQFYEGMALSNGFMSITYFHADRTLTVGQVISGIGDQAAVDATLQRIGVYTVGTDGLSLSSLIAATANDLTMWLATNATYTRSLVGSPTLQDGARYAVGAVLDGAATPPKLTGFRGRLSPVFGLTPAIFAYNTAGGLTDLPASLAAGAVTIDNGGPYVALVP